MKRVILFLTAIGVFGVWGCPRTEIRQSVKLPKFENGDYSTVYMVRESHLYGAGVASPIQVNDVQLFRIGNGDCLSFKIPPGQAEIIYIPQWKRVKLAAERGQKYFVYLRVNTEKSGTEFREITEKEWQEKQRGCNWVPLE